MPTLPSPRSTVVVGMGTSAHGDEGIGLAILECLRESYDVPAAVTLVDGTHPRLLKIIASAHRLLLLDAIESDEPPGTPQQRSGVEVHEYLDLKFAPHQVLVRAALAAADLRRRMPEHLVAIGVQPRPSRPGARLSAEALQGIDHAAALAARQLEDWGFACHPKVLV